MIERNIQARLIFEQNKIMNLYSKHNKSCTESIIPTEVDDGNASFNSLHYNHIIISLENTASEKVSLSSKNEIRKNKDRNRVINNSDFVYEDEPEKILLHNKNVNCENMNEQTEDDNNLKIRKRASAKMQKMGSDEFKKLHEKEALRKKQTY